MLTLCLPVRRKLQLTLLFSVGIFVVIITGVRMPITMIESNLQVDRSFVSLSPRTFPTSLAAYPTRRNV